MAERDLLVRALVAEVLGPRNGPYEVLPPYQMPQDEYITGVLAPHRCSTTAGAGIAPDALDDLIGEDDGEADDDQGTELPPIPPEQHGLTITPALDPRARASSLGVSFLIAGTRPLIDLCCTWARYRRRDDGSWKRCPLGHVWSGVDCAAEASLTPPQDSGVRVQIRCRSEQNRWRVSVFLVNQTPCQDDFPAPEEHVFQAQIRVNCVDGARVIPMDDVSVGHDQEDSSLALLYRARPVFARGHLCAAVWKEVDPERPFSGGKSTAAPFVWVDGDAVFGAAELNRFSCCNVRTEYVPTVAVQSPEKSWKGKGRGPELAPEALSELWAPADVELALAPLADGYEAWIVERESEARAYSPEQQIVAQRHLNQCRAALDRLRVGIDLLVRREDVRLAFCFANRAVAMQSCWTKRRPRAYPWFPFQLAFQLINIPALTDPHHFDRNVCDLLWFPTGGGKTEAYLGLAAFILAFRRLRAQGSISPDSGGGVSVLSRYTLRLLTIQQFRRALAVVTACELLRIDNASGVRGWRPAACTDRRKDLWGALRFSIGLWVGGNVTPNNLQSFQYKDRTGRIVTVPGALDILTGRGQGDGEPAQVLNCPACEAILAVPPDGFAAGESRTLFLVVGDAATGVPLPAVGALSQPPITVTAISSHAHDDPAFVTVRLEITATATATPESLDTWFRQRVLRALGPNAWLVSARASRPGYFPRSAPWGRGQVDRIVDFEIFCPDPRCVLNTSAEWTEQTPAGPQQPLPAFRTASGTSRRSPVPAWTVDEQVYHRCPSIVVATVDKFARLSFEPRAGSLFGNVDRYNDVLGFYRSWCPPQGPSSSLPAAPRMDVPPGRGRNVPAQRFHPPDFILQDELHLIEGPLGSMVGIYETAIDALASSVVNGRPCRPKYIASTATVRRADEQVQAIFARNLSVFPPSGLSIDDSFFAHSLGTEHPLNAGPPGRLYVGICAPGRGAQTPIRNIWARLLQHAEDRRAAGVPPAELDPFWTLVGYFNAIRELAGAVRLTQQDILQRLQDLSPAPRRLDSDDPLELSSRADSMRLPSLLDRLRSDLVLSGDPVNVAVATSMFGTGVDVDRLGLMCVQGQPKTTSAYIQATGRVGRRGGGVVVTFLRAARPRDLNHYEFFTAYHSALYRHVEPITVNPFAPRARDRALGPICVALLRQAAELVHAARAVPVNDRWRVEQRLAGGQCHTRVQEMARSRRDADVSALPEMMEARARVQPVLRRPAQNDTLNHANSELDRWQQLAATPGVRLVYHESSMVNPPSHEVVLGDLAHLVARLSVAYEDAPNSLREVESTTTVRGWR